MSLQTWKDEFYPTPATEDKSIAVAHSLRKWEGLTLEHLRRHGLILLKNTTCIVNEKDAGVYAKEYYDENVTCDKLGIKRSSCSLCIAYNDNCSECPLGKSGNTCDAEESPYEIWLKTSNPKTMIVALKELL